MKVKPVTSKPAREPAAAREQRTPRVAAARRITPGPRRVWSLLLPPTFDRK